MTNSTNMRQFADVFKQLSEKQKLDLSVQLFLLMGPTLFQQFRTRVCDINR